MERESLRSLQTRVEPVAKSLLRGLERAAQQTPRENRLRAVVVNAIGTDIAVGYVGLNTEREWAFELGLPHERSDFRDAIEWWNERWVQMDVERAVAEQSELIRHVCNWAELFETAEREKVFILEAEENLLGDEGERRSLVAALRADPGLD